MPRLLQKLSKGIQAGLYMSEVLDKVLADASQVLVLPFFFFFFFFSSLFYTVQKPAYEGQETFLDWSLLFLVSPFPQKQSKNGI